MSIGVLLIQMQKLNIIYQNTINFQNLLTQTNNLAALDRQIANNTQDQIEIIFKRLMYDNNLLNKARLDLQSKTVYLNNTIASLKILVNSVLNKHTNKLNFFAGVAPFLGLIGTIIGVIHTFHNIAITGNSTIAAIAPGISEALISTGFSIFVAINAISVNSYLIYKKKQIIQRTDEVILYILNLFIVSNNSSAVSGEIVKQQEEYNQYKEETENEVEQQPVSNKKNIIDEDL
jgi:biopolymer transport protein ExbB/TolQ